MRIYNINGLYIRALNYNDAVIIYKYTKLV